jgi:hypothetical protein
MEALQEKISNVFYTGNYNTNYLHMGSFHLVPHLATPPRQKKKCQYNTLSLYSKLSTVPYIGKKVLKLLQKALKLLGIKLGG